MADSINNKRTQQSYLRQVQQEKAQRKRELAEAQKEDMQTVRKYYAEQSKQLDTETAAAVNHIRAESKEIADQEKAAKAEERQYQADVRRQEREEKAASRGIASEASVNSAESVEKKNLYSRPTSKKALVQNYETKDSDDFYRVQDRGSRISENSQAYIIEAYAPEHEKDNLRVTINRNKAIISGQRKSNDEAVEGNKVMRTNNYQSFREEFSLDRPISGQGMTRERIGDYVRFSIPKIEAIENPDEDV